MANGKRRERVRRPKTLFGTTLALLTLAFALLCGSASAVSTHPLDHSFSVGPNCGTADGDLAYVESTELVYVFCPRNFPEGPEIRRFHIDGSPAPFSASQPYISGNVLTGLPNPNAEEGKFGRPSTIAVDNSSVHNGFLYVATFNGPQDIDIFNTSGEWVGAIPTPGNAGTPMSVAVDRQGFIYAGSSGGFGRGHISKFNPSFHEILRIFQDDENWPYIRPDSSGGVWVEGGGIFGRGGGNIFRFEADQFSTNLKTNGIGQTEEAIPGEYSPFAHQPLLTSSEFGHEFRAMDVDPNTDDLYVDRQSNIEPYSPPLPGDPSHPLTPPFASLTNSWGVAVAADGRVLALNEANEAVNVYAQGDTLPEVTTNAPNIPDIGHEGAVLTGRIDPAGGDPITECRLEYGTEFEKYTSGSVPCSPDPSGSNFTSPTDVSATLSGLTIDQPYHYRFVGSNAHGEAFGGEHVVSPVAVLDVDTLPATGVDQNNATLHGVLNPDGKSTTYHFEYGLTTDYRQSTSPQDPGSGSSDVPVQQTVSNLQPGKLYHFRLVAANELGSTFSPDRTFKTASKPQVGGVQATELSATGATLNARINPEGSATTYHFEYGPTLAYGTSAPSTDQPVGSDDADHLLTVPITNLEPGVTYHFKVVATNEWGTSESDDTTFSFSPPNCPNAHVREQTGSNSLPDCRAYELVSPAQQGAAVFWPSNETVDFGAEFGLQSELDVAEWPQYTGYATNPARFTFQGGLGAVPGLDVPNSLLDTYLATRTNSGWETTFPGIKGSETLYTGRRICSESLDTCLDHIVQDQLGGAWPSEDAPFVFDASGKKVDRWPTNVNAIKGGPTFFGDQQPSPDFKHFVFSSRDLAFAPGALTETPGSAYDNDTVDRTVTIVSKLPSGENLPKDGGNKYEVVTFPAGGVSHDGSHILMQTAGHDGAYNLFMRVNDSITYEVSRNHGVTYIGMTKDGSKVLFSSTLQIVPSEDHDTSLDIYEWDEQGDTVKLLTTGNGNGNTDECNTEYASQCGAEPLDTERGLKGGYGQFSPEDAQFLLPGIDSRLATENGAFFFYSPESLDGSKPAVPNERNLYLYRNGEIQLVATLDPGTKINRIQISPDGAHAAFLTASRLTGYDNHGFREMYTYNADTDAIRCASCNPSGAAPIANVQASQGGPFMSDDGRAFFATREALLPQDTDGIIDVYEFVGGRPQLISTGTGTRDFGASGLVQIFFVPEHIGLEAVSHDGTDVFFTTYDTLVSQDHNGNVIKFYDARTNGGFEPPPPLAPCEAADECHGTGSVPESVPQLPSGSDLGAGSNLNSAKKHRKRHHRRHRKKHRRHARHHARHRHG
jgi:hypothetical protein